MARRAPAKRQSRGRQEHPKGPLETVDDAWKDEVRAAMKERGWDQKKLAEQISISEGAISGMFQPGPRQIRFKARIHAALGWSNSAKLEEVLRRIAVVAPKNELADLERVAALLESLAAKR
jgi:hypothetical protein